MRANTVKPFAFTAASSLFIVSFGPWLLLIVVNPSTAIACTPQKQRRKWPSSMGRPAEPHLLRSCSLWVSLYLVGGSLTSWAGNPFEPQFPVFLAQQRLEARLPNSTRSSSSKQRNGVVGLAHSLPTSSATHRFMISVAS